MSQPIHTIHTSNERSMTSGLSTSHMMAPSQSEPSTAGNDRIYFDSRNRQRSPRGDRRRPPTRKAKIKTIERQYRLYQRRALLLLGTAALSFVLFLLFTLPLAALVGLTVMVTSLGACLVVASAAVKTRYQLELQHPLGLVRYLPESLRSLLMEKSLNDCLSPSGSTESLPSLSRVNHSSKDSLSSLSHRESSVKGS